jgi:hypothetical protein
MKTYNLCVDRKYTIWGREFFTVEAESETEAIEKCLNHSVMCNNYEYLDNSDDPMLPKENDNYPILEVFNDDTNEKIFSNNPVSNEDI